MNKKPLASPHIASAAQRIRHVFVRDLELKARLGVYEHEKLGPQRVIVNIDLSVAESDQPHHDNISNVVSYETVIHQVESIIARGHVNLVETLAEKVAEACLLEPKVLAARIRIEKPDVVKNARSVGVEIERSRLAP